MSKYGSTESTPTRTDSLQLSVDVGLVHRDMNTEVFNGISICLTSRRTVKKIGVRR